jgi:vancomycin permeability regulator SanA
LLVEIVAFFSLYYLRYKNQNLKFTGFEDKAGNVISTVFFSVLVILLTTSIFISKNPSTAASFFLLSISVISFISLIASGFIPQKENKIILVSIFLVSNIFLLSSLAGIIFSGTKTFGFLKSLVIFFVILVSSILIVFIYIFNFQDDHQIYLGNNTKADAGVILGAAVWGGNRPSPVLKERINKGYDVYKENLVSKLVITGGGSPNEMTEGEVSKNVLLKYGVAPENLILENSSNSTVEQIQFVRDSLYKVLNWEKIILISDNFHLPRALEICKFNNINAGSIASERDLSSMGTISYCLKESLALIIFWVFGI